MQAIYLVKYGEAQEAFELRDHQLENPSSNEVLIKVDSFGLNFADVMARRGLYAPAPKPPGVIGYEVVGRIEKTGNEVKDLKVGQRVVAFTRFGGYSQYVLTNQLAAVPIPEDIPNGEALGLSVQYSTALYSAYYMANIQKDERVLIHAGAGGVGTALVQLAKNRGCEIYATTSNAEKIQYLKDLGVHHPINYKQNDFVEEVKKLTSDGKIDVAFDPIGGVNYKKSYNLLSRGGRIVPFGASAQLENPKNIIGKLKLLKGFGFINPVFLTGSSKGIIGVNMLAVADDKPKTLNNVMKDVVELYNKKVIKPFVGKEFKSEEISEAHAFLESRKSMGKIVVNW